MKEVVVSWNAIPEGFCGFKKGSKVNDDLREVLAMAATAEVARHYPDADLTLDLDGSSTLQVLVDGQPNQALFDDLEICLLQAQDDLVILHGADGQVTGGCLAGVIPGSELSDEFTIVAHEFMELAMHLNLTNEEVGKIVRLMVEVAVRGGEVRHAPEVLDHLMDRVGALVGIPYQGFFEVEGDYLRLKDWGAARQDRQEAL